MNKRNIIIIIVVLAFIVIIGGISYSYFVYNKDIGTVSLNTGEISLSLSDVSSNLDLTGVVPKSDDGGKISSTYFDFTVNATVDTEKIYYEVYLLPKQGNTLDTSYLKTYLTDQNDVMIKDVALYDDLRASEVENGKVIYRDVIELNNNYTTKNESKDFRLRLWLDESYNEQTSKTFEFDIYVYAKNVAEDYIIPDFGRIIASKASSVNYIASYTDLINSNSNYSTYTTQDQVSTSAPKQTVYYYTGADALANSNVLFAGYCWQIIRTTDNGGVRMIYNGVAVNNKCETTRTVTKGINGTDGASTSLSGTILFGRSYDYDLATGEFTLQDSTGLPTAWNDSNYKDLIGTYTCKSNSATCTTLYYVGSYASSTNAYTASYTIGDVAHFSQLGTSAFNPNYYSPAMVGYMFNTEYDFKSGSKSGEYYTTATWNGTTYDLTSSNNGTAPDESHHYICDSDCTKVRYYYYTTSYYILLENGMTIEDALYQMTGYGNATTFSKPINADYELNNYNSAIKGYLDNWYKKNLTGYTSYLDETSVYCNDRSIIDLGGWNPSGTSLTGYLQFKQYSVNRDLNCVNETDRFAVINNKAKLTYPIGLLTEPERYLMTLNFAATGQYYWGASPNSFSSYYAYVRFVNTSNAIINANVYYSYGARGVVSLRPGTEISSGTGTYTDPYIVGPLVTRTN